MPPGGDGYYYFSGNLLGDDMEIGFFDIDINGDVLCTVRVEQQDSVTDFPQSGCGAAIHAVEGILVVIIIKEKFRDSHFFSLFLSHLNICQFIGDEVQVVYRQGIDTTPLVTGYVNGFTGFRI